MEGLVLRLICTALVIHLLLWLVPEGTNRQVLRFLGGVVLALTLFSGGKALKLPELSPYFQENGAAGEAAAGKGEAMAALAREDIIKARLEAYILTKAAELGAELDADVELSPEGIPVCVTIEGDPSDSVREGLALWLEEAMGISGEALHWSG